MHRSRHTPALQGRSPLPQVRWTNPGRIYHTHTHTGVRQGCPLSSTIFVIATDAIIRYVLPRLRPNDCLRAYADDIALVLTNIWRNIEGLCAAFQAVADGTALCLNPNKCVILPGWRYSTRALRLLLREVVPAWGTLQILDAALNLGIGMGNLGLSLSWRSAARKYEDRLHYVRHLGLGLSAHCLLYNIFAVSTIMYVAQVRPLPQTLLDLEDELLPKRIQLVTNGSLRLLCTISMRYCLFDTFPAP